MLRLVIICLIGSNSYEFDFLLHVALESCIKYIIFVELQNNIQFVVWSSFRDYQECKSIPFSILYFNSTCMSIYCKYDSVQRQQRGLFCKSHVSAPENNSVHICSVAGNTTVINHTGKLIFSSAMVSSWEGLPVIIAINMCVFTTIYREQY